MEREKGTCSGNKELYTKGSRTRKRERGKRKENEKILIWGVSEKVPLYEILKKWKEVKIKNIEYTEIVRVGNGVARRIEVRCGSEERREEIIKELKEKQDWRAVRGWEFEERHRVRNKKLEVKEKEEKIECKNSFEMLGVKDEEEVKVKTSEKEEVKIIGGMIIDEDVQLLDRLKKDQKGSKLKEEKVSNRRRKREESEEEEREERRGREEFRAKGSEKERTWKGMRVKKERGMIRMATWNVCGVNGKMEELE